MSRSRTVGLFCALAVVWGTTFAGIEVGLDSFPPILYAAYRYELAGLLLLGFVAADGERWVPERADLQRIGIRALLMFAAFHALLFVGQGYTTSAVAAIVVGMNPTPHRGLRWFPPARRAPLAGRPVGARHRLRGRGRAREPRPAGLGERWRVRRGVDPRRDRGLRSGACSPSERRSRCDRRRRPRGRCSPAGWPPTS